MNKIMNLLLFILLLILGVILALAPIQVASGIDKVYHFIGFFLITISSILTFISFFGKKKLHYFFVFILVFGGLFAGLSEVLQKITPVRGCDVMDWFTNIAGIGLACFFGFFLNLEKKEY